ncbi:MAG: hypothetical protein ASARMPRED_005437 [Alectoria sarmentosa]|nr:MAG: hypothetical protein ASARMPRED_005437 [Alectoria sarmentosa]
MPMSTYVAIWALALTTPAFAEEPAMVVRAPQAEPTSVVLGTASGGALDPLATRPPHVGPRPAFAGGPDLTIKVVNSFGVPLSIFYGSNAGAPTPVGNPGSGVLTSSTQVLFPSDWAGRITIGKTYDPQGSKIEASYSSPNYVPDVDVSYVDGFSIPISCSCSGVAVTGCNIPLFNDGKTCGNTGPGPICYNPEQDVPNGPASPFFEPCAGAAYTYPNDNAANSYGQCSTGVIDCCVGPQCPAPARQHGKRELSDVSKRHFWARGEVEA